MPHSGSVPGWILDPLARRALFNRVAMANAIPGLRGPTPISHPADIQPGGLAFENATDQGGGGGDAGPAGPAGLAGPAGSTSPAGPFTAGLFGFGGNLGQAATRGPIGNVLGEMGITPAQQFFGALALGAIPGVGKLVSGVNLANNIWAQVENMVTAHMLNQNAERMAFNHLDPTVPAIDPASFPAFFSPFGLSGVMSGRPGEGFNDPGVTFNQTNFGERGATPPPATPPPATPPPTQPPPPADPFAGPPGEGPPGDAPPGEPGNAGDPGAGAAAGVFKRGGMLGVDYAPHSVGPRGTDTVPAWFTPGEYLVPVAQAKKYLPLLRAIRDDRPEQIVGYLSQAVRHMLRMHQAMQKGQAA